MSIREPRFDIDYELGLQGELWVANVRDALMRDRAEVKTDELARETGNVYVEFECKRRRGWSPSGIATTEAEVWVFVLKRDGLALVISRELLLRVARRHWPSRIKECMRGSHPTRGVAVPIGELIAEARRDEAAS